MSQNSRAKPIAALLRPKSSPVDHVSNLNQLEGDLLNALDMCLARIKSSMTPQSQEDLGRLEDQITKFKNKISRSGKPVKRIRL